MSSKQLNSMRSSNRSKQSNSRNTSRASSSSASSRISLKAKKAVNIGKRAGDAVKKVNSGLNYDGTEKLGDYFRRPERLSLESESDNEDVEKESLKKPSKLVRETNRISVSSLSDCEDESFIKQLVATHKRDSLSDFGLSPESSILSVINSNKQRYHQQINNNITNHMRKDDSTNKAANKMIIQNKRENTQSSKSNEGAELQDMDSENNYFVDVSSRKISSFRARRESQKANATSKQAHSKGLSSIGKQAEQLSDVSSDRLDDLELLGQISNLPPELLANQFKQQLQSQVTPFSHQKYSNIDDFQISLSHSDIKQSEDKQNQQLGQSPKENETRQSKEQDILEKDMRQNQKFLKLQQRINNMEDLSFTDENKLNRDKNKKNSLSYQNRKDHPSRRISVFDAGKKNNENIDNDDLEIQIDSDEEISKWLKDNRRIINEMSIRKKQHNKSGISSSNSGSLLDISESRIGKSERFSDQVKRVSQLSYIEEINTQQENNNQQYYINANEAVQIEQQKDKEEEGKKDAKDVEILMNEYGYQNDSLHTKLKKSKQKIEKMNDLGNRSLKVKESFQSEGTHVEQGIGDRQANDQLTSKENNRNDNIEEENRIFEIEESLNLQPKRSLQSKGRKETSNKRWHGDNQPESSISKVRDNFLNQGEVNQMSLKELGLEDRNQEELQTNQNKKGIIGKGNSENLLKHQQDEYKNKEGITSSSSSEAYQFEQLGQFQQNREEEMIFEKKINKQNSSGNHSMEVERNQKGDHNGDGVDYQQDLIEQQQQQQEIVEDYHRLIDDEKIDVVQQRQRGNNKRKQITPIKYRNLSNDQSSFSSDNTEKPSKKLKKPKNSQVLPQSLQTQNNSTSDTSSSSFSLIKGNQSESSYSNLEKSKVQKKKKKTNSELSAEYTKIFERGFHKDQVEHQVQCEQENFGKEGRYPVRKRIRPLLGWCERAVYGKQGLLYIIADSSTDNLTSVNYRIKDFSNVPQSRRLTVSRNLSNDRKQKNKHRNNDASLPEIKEIIDEPEESKGKQAKQEKQKERTTNRKQEFVEQRKDNINRIDKNNEKEKENVRKDNSSKENRQGNSQNKDQLMNQGIHEKMKKGKQSKTDDQFKRGGYEEGAAAESKQNDEKSMKKNKNLDSKLKVAAGENKNQKKMKSNDSSLISDRSTIPQEQSQQQQKKRSGSAEESIGQKKSLEKIVVNTKKNKQNENLAAEVGRKQLHLDYIRSQLTGLEIDKIKLLSLSDIDENEDQNSEFKGKQVQFNYSLAPGQSITRAESQFKGSMHHNSKSNQNSNQGCKIEIKVLECEPKKLILKLHGDPSTSSYLKEGDKKLLQKSIQFTILHRNSNYHQSENVLHEAIMNFTLNPVSVSKNSQKS